jgi:hypothetical protein
MTMQICTTVLSGLTQAAASHVRAQVRLCEIYCGQNGTGVVSSNTFVSPANSHPTNCTTFNNHPIIDPI